ncbi:hypothetical protein MTR67_023568 [Solanum verrucosum]|uniref:Uncharacterized protein n=1 Tax=Solanum verrucosum TaxID=315347 RepID=A0AAF0QXD3_SOLVR|nr:hypothetical protein MTR67_023568 [Solanum verrucosum]
MHTNHTAPFQEQSKKTTGIDSNLPNPQNPNVNYDCIVDEADGGMDRGSKEKPTDLQEGVTKGGNLTHVLHEGVHNDLNRDLRASVTTLQNNVNAGHHVQESHKELQTQGPDNPHEKQPDSTEKHVRTAEESEQQEGQGMNVGKNNQTPKKKGTAGSEVTQNPIDAGDESGKKTPNNKSKGKMSKKKRETIKRRQQAEIGKQGSIKEHQQQHQKIDTVQHCQAAENEYANIQSEDEFDQDTQSLNEHDEDEEETNIHLIKAFGSTMFQQEVKEVTDQQGLSPRGRQHTNQDKTNTSATQADPTPGPEVEVFDDQNTMLEC